MVRRHRYVCCKCFEAAEVDKVIIEEDLKKIDVIVPDEQLSLAIGRKGQNVRLASALSGWSIDILTISQESKEEVRNLRICRKILLRFLMLTK